MRVVSRLFGGWRRAAIGAAALLLASLPILFLGAATDPNVLWKIVDGKCVPDQRHFGHPFPCAAVDLPGGYAILKDIVGATQYLLIPTTRVTGIESPAILAPTAPNYFAEAWSQMPLVEGKLGHSLPPADLSLAINSFYGRSQQQLHIHMDCIRPDVRDALARHAASIGPHWAPFPERLAGHPYRAIRIAGASLAGHNAFLILADQEPGARADMARHTLVLAGAPDGASGFVLLDGLADPAHGNFGSGEDLQDHACAIGRSH